MGWAKILEEQALSSRTKKEIETASLNWKARQPATQRRQHRPKRSRSTCRLSDLAFKKYEEPEMERMVGEEGVQPQGQQLNVLCGLLSAR